MFKKSPRPLRGNEQGERLEAPPGFEPGSQGFADPCLTTWLWRQKISAEFHLERETRFELATFTLAR